MDITWTRKKECGSEGMTHRASITLPSGEELHLRVDSPAKGHWHVRGWRAGTFCLYREDTTVKGARGQAEDFAAELITKLTAEQLPAALTGLSETAEVATESLRQIEFRQSLAAATELVKAARARVQFRRDTCGCRHPLHTMRCGFGGTVTVLSR
jgi:hypothetical protein